MNRNRLKVSSYLAMAVAAGVAFCAMGANDWTGAGGDGLVSNPANWSLNKVPDGGDAVRFYHNTTVNNQRTLTFDCVISAGSHYVWAGANSGQVMFDPVSGACLPITFQATDPANGLTQAAGTDSSFRFCDGDDQNLALRILSGTYTTAAEAWIGLKGKAWFDMQGGTINVGSNFKIAQNANAYADVTFAGGLVDIKGDLNIANNASAVAKVVIGSGDPAKTAVVSVPNNKWAILTSVAGGTATMTLRKGGEFRCGVLNCRSVNSTLIFDGGTLKNIGQDGNVRSHGYLITYCEDHAQDTVGRRILFTENGGTIDTILGGHIDIPMTLDEGTTATTLTKRGIGALVLGSVGEGFSVVVQDGSLQVENGTLAALTLAGGYLVAGKIPAHAEPVQVTGGRIIIPAVDETSLVDGVAVATGLNLNDFALAEGLVPADVFDVQGAERFTFEITVADDGAISYVPHAANRLPAGYTRLSYIQSLGGQYILTGFLAQHDTRVQMDFGGVHYVASVALFGQDVWGGSRFLFNMQNNTSANRFMFHSAGAILPPVEANTDYSVLVEPCTITLTKVSTGTETRVAATNQVIATANRELAIFGLNNGDKRSIFKFYRMKMWAGGEDLVRDFVPCQNAQGEAGLYDLVGRRFYANAGTGSFAVPGDETREGYLDYIESTSDQYINTGFVLGALSKVECVVNVKSTQPKDWSAVFGSRKSSYYYNCYGFFAKSSRSPTTIYARTNAETPGGPIITDAKVKLTCYGMDASWYRLDDPTVTGAIKSTGSLNDCVNSCYIFDLNKYDGVGDLRDTSYCLMKLYSFKIMDGDVVQRDLVPYRKANGEVGLVDRVHNNTFYGNLGASEPFVAGMGRAYYTTGTDLELQSGTFTAADVPANCSEITKVGLGTVNVAGVTSFPALTVEGGYLSFADNAAATHTVAGTFALAGGSHLVFDVTPDGNDTLACSRLDLSTATTLQPVTISVNAFSVAGVDAPRTLLTWGALTEADLARFVLASDIPARLAVANGNLQLVPQAVEGAVWIGGGANGNWSTAANWQNGLLPQNGASVTFTAAGGETTMDLSGLLVSDLAYTADAASYTHGGESLLGVQMSITNASTAAQTITAPVTLGSGGTFDLNAVGPVTITGDVSVNAENFVKTGEGALTIDDTAVHQAKNVTVAEGELRLVSTSTAKAKTDGTGTIQVAAGARLALDVDNGFNNRNVVEPTRGKTVTIAGAGPDGKGALYNYQNQLPTGDWAGYLSRLVVTGEALVGGGHFGVRTSTDSGITQGRVEGAFPLTLNTVKEAKFGFTFYGVDFALDSIRVTGKAQFENTLTGTITNGVHLADGGQVDIFAVTMPATMPFFVDEGADATFYMWGGTSTIATPVNVASNATLNLTGSSALTINGPIVNHGTIVRAATADVTFTGPITGTGVFENSAGWLNLIGDKGEQPNHVKLTGGGVRFGNGGTTAAPTVPPVFDEVNANVQIFVGQPLAVGSQYDDLVTKAGANKKDVAVLSANENAVVTLKGANWAADTLTLGNTSTSARFCVDEGTTLAARQITINPNRLTQVDGTIELGSGGLQTSVDGTLTAPHAVLQQGTLKATADFANNSRVLAAFGTEMAATGNSYTLDLNGHAVTWGPILGSSDVTLAGAGSFTSVPSTSVSPLGKWTIDTDASASVNLAGADAFPGGLELAENVTATVGSDGFVLRRRIEGGSLNQWLAKTNSLSIYTDRITNFDEMNKASGRPTGTFYITYSGQFYVPAEQAGEWFFLGAYDDVSYLEIDGVQVGNLKLDNDWTSKKTGSRELAVGWHDFTLYFGQHTGGWGPILSNGRENFAFGWTTNPESAGSTDATRYEAFAPSTLKMRGMPSSSVRWQHDTRFTSNNNNLDDWMETTTTYNGVDQTLTSVKDILCSTSNTMLDSMRNRVSGYVYIPKSGTWKVKGKFDDKFCLRLDGQIVVSYPSFDAEFSNDNVPIERGWHFFDIQIADTYGGYGANYIDANGQRCAVAFCAPDDTRYLAFTEDNFHLSAYLPGLSGETMLGEGSTLKSDGTGCCAINGVLAGSGALEGRFAFGPKGTWRVTVGLRDQVRVDASALVNTDFTKNLKAIEVVIDGRAGLEEYPLCAAGETTAEDAAAIVVTAHTTTGKPETGWRAVVKADGQLVLRNPKPNGFAVFLR